MQIKTTRDTTSHLSELPSLINQLTKMLARLRRKGNPSVLLVGMQTGAATVENSMEFPQKLKMKLPFDLVTLLLGLYPTNPETPIQKNLCTPMFIAALFIIPSVGNSPSAHQ